MEPSKKSTDQRAARRDNNRKRYNKKRQKELAENKNEIYSGIKNTRKKCKENY